jgi:hypothetical protein
MQAFDPIVGAWASRGRTVARPGEPSIAIEGTDVYEWLAGGHFLVHHVDVRVAGEQLTVLEVIGEPDGDGFAMRSFDNGGNAGTMRATVDTDGVWTFAGETERARLTVAPDGRSMAARWERRADGPWEHWMDMEFARAPAQPSQRSSQRSFQRSS